MEQDKGNPKEANQPSDNTEAQGKVFGSSSDFFSQLEQEYNGAVDDSLLDTNDPPPKNEPGNESPVNTGPAQATPLPEQGNSNSIDWEKRYKSSSNEARKLNEKLKETSKFEPLLNVMRKDKGLVQHIKEYLEAGGTPKSMKEKLGVPDDFVYDPQEAMEDPESNSAKLFNAQVDKAVNAKVDKKHREKVAQVKMQTANAKKLADAKRLMARHNLSTAQLKVVYEESKKRNVSLDDAYYLMNKSQVVNKAAANTRHNMINQMQNARNIPKSVSHSNSAQVEKDPTNDLFDTLKGSDDADNLFG